MNLTPEDPILTAYALGELPDGEEKRTLEAALENDPVLRDEVRRIRVAARTLEKAFATEIPPVLSESEKQALLDKTMWNASRSADRGKRSSFDEGNAARNSERKLIRFSHWMSAIGGAAAACLVMAVAWRAQELPRQVPSPGVYSSDTMLAEESLPAAQRVATADPATVKPLDAMSAPQPESPPSQRALPLQYKAEYQKPLPQSKPTSQNQALSASAPSPEVGKVVVSGMSIEMAGYAESDSVLFAPVDSSTSSARGRLQEQANRSLVKANNIPSEVSQLNDAAVPVETAEDKLRKIIIPKVSFNNMPLSRVIETLNELSVRYDTNQDGTLPQIEYDAKSLGDPSVSITLRNFSMDKTLEFVSKSVGRTVRYEDGKVFIGMPEPRSDFSTESYDTLVDNPFRSPFDSPLSTFSIDVDSASYANVRRFIENGQLPPMDAVRVEEMVNYFPYDYAAPTADAPHPFNVHVETASAPWSPEHRLLRIGLKGYELDWSERPPANLVFLLDVSGSMTNPNKLPLVKDALRLLAQRLDGRDRVAIVVYAGASGLALPSTTANNVETITHALDNLEAGGSTNGGAGIALAYKVAREQFLKEGNNRVILCTDGDFNVGTTDRAALLDMLEAGAKDGIYLSILGFGMGNYQDGAMEELSNKGNGNYAYIDSQREARKVLVEQAAGTLLTIAKDVKIQVEFNPAEVAAYRLIGYANRMLAAEDFNDDTKDAGEIGAGHSVTALYEIIPAGVGEARELPTVDPLKYQPQKNVRTVQADDQHGELATVKLRYKEPDSETSTLLQVPVTDREEIFAQASEDFRFASAVAGFGMLLRESEYRGDVSLSQLQTISRDALGEDPNGYRTDFTALLELAQPLIEARNTSHNGMR